MHLLPLPRGRFVFAVLILLFTGCRTVNFLQPPSVALNNGGAYLHSPLPFVRSEPAFTSDFSNPAVVRGRSRVVPAPLPPETKINDSAVAGTGYRPDDESEVRKLTKELDELPTTNVPPRASGPSSGKSAAATDVELAVESVDTLSVNGEVTFKIRLTNTGNHPARDLVIQCDFDEELSFPGREERGIIQRLGELPPGESQEIELSLLAKTEGKTTALFTARSSSVNAIIPVSRKLTIVPQALFLELTGTGNARVGDRLEYRVTVRNLSASPLKNVRIRLSADKSLRPSSGAGSPETHVDGFGWNLSELQGNEIRTFDVILEPLKIADAAEVIVEGSADGIPADKLRATIEILPTPSPPMTRLNPPEIELGAPESL